MAAWQLLHVEAEQEELHSQPVGKLLAVEEGTFLAVEGGKHPGVDSPLAEVGCLLLVVHLHDHSVQHLKQTKSGLEVVEPANNQMREAYEQN